MATGNRGNHRTGQSRGTHSGRRRGTLPWRDDPLIMERLALVRRMWAEGYGAQQMLPVVNSFQRSKGQPEVAITTIYGDRARIKELLADESNDIAERHEEVYRLVQQEAWKAFRDTATKSLNKSTYLNIIKNAEDSLARASGYLKDRSETRVAVDHKVLAINLVKVLVQELGDAERVERIVESIANSSGLLGVPTREESPEGTEVAS